jgi:hypothetical protein
MNPNPLNQYFRTPALHVSLPSQGKFYTKNSLEPAADHQYPVLPMSRQDELVFMSATAYTGSSIASIIASCVPNIKDVWKMPAIDVDKLLVAIKIASHGNMLKSITVCTNCQTENKINVDLNQVLDQFESPNYDQPLVLQDLKIYFRPIVYQQANDNMIGQISEQAVLDTINDDLDENIRSQKIDQLLEKIRELATSVLAKHVLYIQTPDVRVDNQLHIAEWLTKCDRETYLKLQQHVVGIKQQTEIKPVETTCAACSTTYQANYNLNLTNQE